MVLLLVAAANPLRLGAYSGFFGFLLGEPMVTVSGGAALATLIVVLVRRQRWWQAPPGRNKVAGLLLVLLQVLMFLGYAVTAFLW